MPVLLQNVKLYNVDKGEGKNGIWCNFTILHESTTSQATLMTKDLNIISTLENLKGKQVNITAKYIQNKFGERLSEIVSVELCKVA